MSRLATELIDTHGGRARPGEDSWDAVGPQGVRPGAAGRPVPVSPAHTPQPSPPPEGMDVNDVGGAYRDGRAGGVGGRARRQAPPAAPGRALAGLRAKLEAAEGGGAAAAALQEVGRCVVEQALCARGGLLLLPQLELWRRGDALVAACARAAAGEGVPGYALRAFLTDVLLRKLAGLQVGDASWLTDAAHTGRPSSVPTHTHARTHTLTPPHTRAHTRRRCRPRAR
jgi:hypothetical protein